jgi:hypothetical protein
MKTPNSIALIQYGPTLPTVGISDGTMFYKTSSADGTAQGLYVYGFIRDSNSSAVGFQVSQGWQQAISNDAFVLKTGDVMLGSLEVPGFIRITQTSADSQRLLVGNQAGAGANKPGIVEGQNGIVKIGYGTSWAGNGGTLVNSLNVDASTASGLTFRGAQVWHAGNDGSGSTLDADLLDGQDGTYYLALANGIGTLAISKGGTGATSTTQGGVVFGASATSYGTTAAGTSGYLLSANGSNAPSWLNPASITVGNATNATYATTAGSASSATTAATASNVAWTGITGFSSNAYQTFSPASGTAYARPSIVYDFGSSGVASLAPNQIPAYSLTGFESYNTSDIGQYQVGVTVFGGGLRGLQIAGYWNFEEAAPAGGLKYRVNDDTSNPNAWGAFRGIWDQGNLTNVSQLNNDANYVQSTGDTMTGLLRGTAFRASQGLPSGGDSSTTGFAFYNNGDTGLFASGSNATTTGAYLSLYGDGTERVRFTSSQATFYTSIFVNGDVNASGDVVAGASDKRLKKNITLISSAVQKVKQLGGYEYDWDMEACDVAGFVPRVPHEHGLLAQEVREVMPDAVVAAPFNNDYLTVKYEKIVSLLVRAINEQQEMIDELKAEVVKLKAKGF